uniref:Very low-density lipoprotein receptor n=1 Tax=Macrostomum lignano TaxID=282301 RepID=A0A1I8JPQ8_9PLAT
MRYSSGRHAVKFMLLLYSSLLSLTVPVPAISLTGLSKEDFMKLLVYCEPNTGYFECHNATADKVYCLPESLKCQIQCSNDADFGCDRGKQLSFIALLLYIAAAADVGKSAASAATLTCPSPASSPPAPAEQLQPQPASALHRRPPRLRCRPHCPDAADESLELCKRRRCAHGQFAPAPRAPATAYPPPCAAMAASTARELPPRLRPGRLLRRDGLPRARGRGPRACGPDQFRCLDGKSCVTRSFVCDDFKDCFDGSDESPDICRAAAADCEFHCDGRCLKASVRCDGTIDCSSGQDEIGCPGRVTAASATSSPCRFSTGKGPRDPACVPINFVCDGISECLHGEDEVCPIDRVLCATDSYWTCKNGQHCIPVKQRCDGLLHCPDGSDERGCATAPAPTALPDPSASACQTRLLPPGRRSVAGACQVADECTEEFGTCDHRCRSTRQARPAPACPATCPMARTARRCRAVGAAKLLYSTQAGVRLLDSDTKAVT